MKKLIRAFFFLKRGERRGLVFSSFILFISILYRIWVLHQTSLLVGPDLEFLEQVEKWRAALSVEIPDYKPKKSKSNEKLILQTFSFDPNVISVDSLHDMNLPAFLISNIDKYRKAGGSFTSTSDLKKIYGMNDVVFQQLVDCVRITSSIQVDQIRKDISYIDSMTYSFPIDLNGADSLELVQLPGIGPSFSRRIIKYRELLGGYVNECQLLEVYGMDSLRYNLFADRVIVDTMFIRKIEINQVSYRELLAHPYFDRKMVQSIIEYRDYIGEIKNLKELEDTQLLDRQSWQKISPYISCEKILN